MRTLIAFLVLFSYNALAKECQSELVVSYNGDWKPYFYQFGNGLYEGIDFTLLNRVVTAMGCEVDVLPMTEARSIIELGKGSFDISIGASYTPERAEQFYYSLPYRQEMIGVMFFNNAAHNRHTPLRDVLEQGGVVGINMSGYFGDVVEELKAQYPAQFVHGFSLPERISMLSEGKIDAVVDDRGALCHQMKGLKVTGLASLGDEASDLVLSDEILHDNEVFFLFSRLTVDAAYVEMFNHHLERALSQPTESDMQCR
ncbi:substrate-binding periplasmic protein [Alteromonas sp. H39]|uniref:substrate-binding periplasmic protein n=1 Tax=Alteromonas sp. H39 TaxID=3389876 RepID=UPI0039E0F8FB